MGVHGYKRTVARIYYIGNGVERDESHMFLGKTMFNSLDIKTAL